MAGAATWAADFGVGGQIMTMARGDGFPTVRARPRNVASPFRRVALAAGIAFALITAPLPVALAQQEQPFRAFEIRRTYASDMGVSSVAGVAYRAQSDTLFIADRAGQAVQVTRAGEATGSPSALQGDPLNLTIDAAGNAIVAAGTLSGAAFDPATGAVYGLEGNDLVDVATGQRTTLQGTGGQPNRGLAIDPATGFVYVGSPSGKKVNVFDRTGARVETIDLSGVEIADQQGMTIAPSADPTDDPSVQRLYVADGLGALIEVALAPETIVATAATVSVATLRRIYETGQGSPVIPNSPDPSGVTYIPSRGDLLVSDGEVDETTGAGFNNVNIWYIRPSSGAATATGNTVALNPNNTEPTGVDFDPVGNRLFVTNDNSGGFVDVHQPGGDGMFATPDDTKYRMSTNGFGLPVDSEGVAYHQGNGHIYIADGVGREVWDVNPGPNGIFEGGGSDDTLTHFDVNQYGATDPEGIAYSSASGRLLLLDDSSATVYELEISGNLVNQIDISASTGTRQAGVTLAPASSQSGESLYIVDRRVDNGENPNENDGRMYEMSAPLAPAGNQPPVANGGPDQQVNGNPSAVATLDGSASTDDNAITGYAWSQVSGPTATINSPGTAISTVNLSVTGTYVFALTVTDAEAASDTDEMTILVVGPGGPFNWDGVIATGSDDAEQLGSGTMRLANADLELVVKAADIQQVGLRFTGVTIPKGANIDSAYVQFRSNGVSTGSAPLTIRAQASDNAPTFASQTFNISSRTTGTQSVSWNPPDWTVDNEAGPNQQTSDITTLVQEVVQRAGWAPGNAIALIITGPSGTRVANALEGGFASELHVVYSTGGPPPNQPPTANAGVDQQVTGLSATLAGSATDPENGALTYLWSQTGGPSGAQVANPTAATTNVILPSFGTYTFELTATDPGNLTDTDEVMVTAVDPSGPVTVEVPVATGADDAEEKLNGAIALANGDLDMVDDTTTTITTALRFTGVAIPVGATITSAFIQFRADETQGGLTPLTIAGHDVENAPALTTVNFSITTRDRTEATVAWNPDPWVKNQTGSAQQTTNLTPIIDELRSNGWSTGEAMVFIITGSGKRTADSSEGGFAPRLVITYTP